MNRRRVGPIRLRWRGDVLGGGLHCLFMHIDRRDLGYMAGIYIYIRDAQKRYAWAKCQS
jgi:hypothetical protein